MYICTAESELYSEFIGCCSAPGGLPSLWRSVSQKQNEIIFNPKDWCLGSNKYCFRNYSFKLTPLSSSSQILGQRSLQRYLVHKTPLLQNSIVLIKGSLFCRPFYSPPPPITILIHLRFKSWNFFNPIYFV